MDAEIIGARTGFLQKIELNGRFQQSFEVFGIKTEVFGEAFECSGRFSQSFKKAEFEAGGKRLRIGKSGNEIKKCFRAGAGDGASERKISSKSLKARARNHAIAPATPLILKAHEAKAR